MIEAINRVWDRCFQPAVKDGAVNPWNYGHPYHNNYKVSVEVEYGISAMRMKEISSEEEIFRVVVWHETELIEVQGMLIYKEREDSFYEIDEDHEFVRSEKVLLTRKLISERHTGIVTDIVLFRLNMKGEERDQAHYLVQRFAHKNLYCGYYFVEKIIIIICLYVKFSHTQKQLHNEFNICNENDVTEYMYGEVVSNLASKFISLSQEKNPLTVEGFKYEWPENQKRKYSDVIFSNLHMNSEEKNQAHYLVQELDFEDLCGECSIEQVITVIGLFVISLNAVVEMNEYSCEYPICYENNVDQSLYNIVITRIALQCQRKVLPKI